MPPQRLYTILSQREDRIIGPDGRATDGVHIAWQGPNGITGNVTLAEAEYSAANVDQRIREKINTHLSVRQLGEQNT